MSVVTVQLGQCGNQVGYHFFESLSQSAAAASAAASGTSSTSAAKNYFSNKNRDDFVQELIERFFHERPFPLDSSSSSSSSSPSLEARAVLIDMETKVVDHVTREAAAASTSSGKRLAKWGDGRGGKGGGGGGGMQNFQWRFNSDRTFSRKMGSGNNWANGFSNYGAQYRDEIVDVVRREVEACDAFQGFLLLMSLAGGTGSGLGTAVATTLRDAFGGVGGKTCFCQAVWPHASGEVVLQNYNSLLSIAHLSQVSDAVMLQFNDVLHHVCTKRLHLKHVLFSDMNGLIAHHLSSLLSPAWPVPLSMPFASTTKPERMQPSAPDDDSRKRMDKSATRPRSGMPPIAPSHPRHDPCQWNVGRRPSNSLTELAVQLTPHPGYKLLQSYSLPVMSANCLDFTRDEWDPLVKRLRQMLLTNFSIDEGLDWHVDNRRDDRNRSLANALFLRGNDLDLTAAATAISDDNRDDNLSESPSSKRFNFQALRDRDLYASWVPSDSRFHGWASPFPLGGYEKSATLLSNCGAVAAPLDAVLTKAWKMFGAKAYLHQYDAFGFAQDDFLNCFATVQQIVKNYEDI